MSSLSSAAASSWFTRLGTAYRSGRIIKSRNSPLLLSSFTHLPCWHSHASSILATCIGLHAKGFTTGHAWLAGCGLAWREC